MEDRPEYDSALGRAATRVAVRWLGRRADLLTLPEVDFRARLVISITDPAQSRTRFVLVGDRASGRIQLRDLLRWLHAAAGPEDWIAIHSAGADALIGSPERSLLDIMEGRRRRRVGVVLRLSAARAGDPVDYARLTNTRASASSFETLHDPARVTALELWPRPLAPGGWVSQPMGNDDEPHWIELQTSLPQPIERVVAVWAGAHGLSPELHPGAVRLLTSSQPSGPLDLTAEAEPGDDPVSSWAVSGRPRRVRLEFERPARDPLGDRARVAAIMLIGPYDGRTQPR